MDNDFILVLDLGGTEAVAMARKLRALGYYSEILPADTERAVLKRKKPNGVLIAGGREESAFPLTALSLDVPVLSMGPSSRAMARALGAQSQGIQLANSASQITFSDCALFEGLSESDRYFARIDGLELSDGFAPIATTIDGLVPAFADLRRALFGLQFYAESNDPDGAAILANYAGTICRCSATWSIESYIDREVSFIRERVGDGHALMAISGGVDSSACAMLMHRALGDRLTCVFIDNGLLRDGEVELVLNAFQNELGLHLAFIDARDRFQACLEGIADPGAKQRAVHNMFVDVFSEVIDAHPEAEFLAKGTIYSELLASAGSDEGLRRFEAGKLIEPLRMLFKDEVRALAHTLGLPPDIAARQSFPEAGLAMRCLGTVSGERLRMLRRADSIFQDEIVQSGQDKRLTHYFVVLGDTAVHGGPACDDEGCACILRAVSRHGATTFSVGKLPYDLLERISRRITTEVPGIHRVMYDITDSGSSTIEWE